MSLSPTLENLTLNYFACVFDTESGQADSETHSLRGEKGRVASKTSTLKATSGTRSLRGRQEEHVVLDTGEFVTNFRKSYTKLIGLCL